MIGFTFEELSKNFEQFKEIFNNASHAPFESAFIQRPNQPGQLQGHMREQRARRERGLPPIYLDPEPGFVAKIILIPNIYDIEMRNKEYVYLITPEGGITFKARVEFHKQPKMKWAKLITKWLENLTYASYMRHVNRFNKFSEELVATVYSPEWLCNLGANIEDRSHIEYLHYY